MSVYAARYARALVQVLQAENVDALQADRQLQDFRDTFAASTELRELFDNPSVPLESKLKVVDAMASRLQLFAPLRNFLAVLLQNDRMNDFPEILAEYRREMDVRLNIGEAEITSIRELDQQERSNLEAQAAGLTGKNIRAVYRQDPSLLGGVVLRIGTILYDGSVRGRLDRLRQQLVEN